MGVRKKNRRKLTVNERAFLWYVRDDPDSADRILHVLSDHKRFIVTYRLGQAASPGARPVVVVLGREFPGLPDAGGCWIRVECPAWSDDAIVGPGFVRRLVAWCLDSEKEAPVRVDWRGRPSGDPPDR